MIPQMSSANESSRDFKIVKEPSLSYKLKFDKDKVEQYINGLEAIKQAVFKVLLTDRYKYEVYNWNYGIELDDLFGKQKEYVYSELERRIKDALAPDDRIQDVYNFIFSEPQDGEKTTVCVTFTVKSIFGESDFTLEAVI